MRGDMDDTKELKIKLLRYYQENSHNKKNFNIANFAHISDGWENEVYAFTLKHGDGREDLILRIYPGDNSQAKSSREFNGMQNLYKQGYPVPQVFIHERDTSWFSSPFVIMQKINGRSMGEALSGVGFFRKGMKLIFNYSKLEIRSSCLIHKN